MAIITGTGSNDTPSGWVDAGLITAQGGAGTATADDSGAVAGAATGDGVTPGTRIATPRGEVAVECLRPGDLVLTRDDGYVPLSWVGQRDLTADEIAAHAPVRIAKGALGQGAPECDMVVSPWQRMLMTGPRAQLFFGENEVLVPAVHMVTWPGVTRVLAQRPVSYLHVMFEDHQIICADGAWTESAEPGGIGVSDLGVAQRQGRFAMPPAPRACLAARMTLRAHESRLLMPA